MEIEKTKLPEVLLVTHQIFEDTRGWFYESYNRQIMESIGINSEFIQDNQSLSVTAGTVRGIHFQNAPVAQSKLVRCIIGKIFDVAVDLRKGSETYGEWVAVELSAENKKQLFIPKGFGHAFMTLVDNTQVCYKVDAPWSKEHERNIRWDDSTLGIVWPSLVPILSPRDRDSPKLSECGCNFAV